jgi:hypothetical protein
MQGGAKRQVNAEEMLAELKRLLESSTRAPDVPPPSAPKVSLDLGSWRSQIDKRSDLPLKANADDSIGLPTDSQKSTRSSSRSWKLTAGGLALAGAAAISGSFALVNKAPNPPKPEPSVVATEGLVRPPAERTLQPSSNPNPPVKDSRQDALLQVFNAETRPDAGAAPENGGSLPARGEAKVDAPHAASLGLESAAPAFTPEPAAASAAPQMVRPDGALAATPPPAPASTDSAPPAETPKQNATPTAHVSNESARPSAAKVDSKKKPPGKTSLQKLAKSAKASAKPVAQAERQSSELARPKEAEKSPQPAQDAGNPIPVAPAAPTATVQQRFADGMTHAFSYLMHLPGALVPHPADPNADAR